MSDRCYVAYRLPRPQAEALRRYIIENIDFGPEVLFKKHVHGTHEQTQLMPLEASNPTVAY
jgi:hypothetical protein